MKVDGWVNRQIGFIDRVSIVRMGWGLGWAGTGLDEMGVGKGLHRGLGLGLDCCGMRVGVGWESGWVFSIEETRQKMH